ncbi:MAG: hypothetical protein J6O60_02350 [Lachnospiraceae bacterium]|nr:hypothetical protein [Lachnospiraceae bacterium]
MVKNCATCNRIFDDYLDIYRNCPECREKEAGLLRQVKDYLWDYPGATEGKLREVFGVTHQQVTTWLREERIEITPDSSIKLTCLRCGSMILKGKYCPDCAKRIGVQLEQLKKELSPKEKRQHKNIYSMVVDKDMAPGGKMHFLQNASRERRSDSERNLRDSEYEE